MRKPTRSSKNSTNSGAEKDLVPEIRLRARAVSRGISIGKIVCLHGQNRQFYRTHLRPTQIDAELRRLRRAIVIAKRQLASLVSRKTGRIADSGPGIFETHKMLIEDSSLQAKYEKEIVNQRVNAEWAIKHVTDLYVAKYKAIDDEHLRDRYIDIEDVAERILVAIDGGAVPKLPFAGDAIIAAKELRPSTLIEFADDAPRALITENGGWTSHTFILARELGWPSVTGIKKVLRRVKDGDRVIVDGFNGEVILNPTPATIERYTETASAIHRPGAAVSTSPAEPLKTLDGLQIRIYANADSPEKYASAAEAGAQGIGLYRSEYLFDRYRGFPAETDQLKAYRAIADAVRPNGANIRTFDIGPDQLVDQYATREKNPALGLRAVRLGLRVERSLRTQIRAILRASSGRSINLLVPMVSGVSEIRAVRSVMQEEADDLKRKGKEFGSPPVGAMIEVPSAVLMIDEIVAETDFVCLGTNDLIQYLLAVDRDNESVAGWYRTLHPAVLRAIRQVLAASAAAGKSAILCGEMAGSPYYVPVLIGLGATALSINITSIAKVRNVVAGIAAEEATVMMDAVSAAAAVDNIEVEVDRHIKRHWKHLFPPDFSFSSG